MASEEETMLIPCSTKIMNVDIPKFRKLVKKYMDRHHYIAAEFWANKLVTISGGAHIDLYYLAQCYYLTRQYHRAVLLLTSHNLTRNGTCRYLAAKCYYEVGEYQSALNLLDTWPSSKDTHQKNSVLIPELDDLSSIESSVHLLRGYIHEASDNRTLARESFLSAIQTDPLCYEAFRALTQHHMMPPEEEKHLLQSLNFTDGCTESEEAFVRLVYETQLSKYTGVKPKLSNSVGLLETNLDFLTAEAETLYYNCNFAQCYKLTQKILQKDPYHPECLPIHIACLVELKQPNSLFLLGHKLVDLYPDSSLSWFAVGCYYFLIVGRGDKSMVYLPALGSIGCSKPGLRLGVRTGMKSTMRLSFMDLESYLIEGKNDHARRFLSKATSLDRILGPAWIAYGHSFAAENEHDQARAAYYKAAQLMKGCHLPLLYIGMEYSLTNNPKFAERFLKQAHEIAPDDPFVHHELGVVAYASQDYVSAELCFRHAVSVVEQSSLSIIPEKWSTLLQNLALTLCKLGKFAESLEFLQYRLRVSSGNASAYAALGLVHSYLGNYEEAVVTLHKALSLQKDHTVAASLLTTLMNQVMLNSPTFEGSESPLAFDMIPTVPSGIGLSQQCQSISAKEDATEMLGCSLGQPTANSSDLGSGTGTGSSALVMEDMVMDDESP